MQPIIENLKQVNTVSVTTFQEDDGFYLLVIECKDREQAIVLLTLFHENDFRLNIGFDINEIPVIQMEFTKANVVRDIRLADSKPITLFDKSLIKYLTTGFNADNGELATLDAHIVIGGFQINRLN